MSRLCLASSPFSLALYHQNEKEEKEERASYGSTRSQNSPINFDLIVRRKKKEKDGSSPPRSSSRTRLLRRDSHNFLHKDVQNVFKERRSHNEYNNLRCTPSIMSGCFLLESSADKDSRDTIRPKKSCNKVQADEEAIIRNNRKLKEGAREGSIVALLQACAELKDLERGRRLHAEIARRGSMEKDIFVGSALVSMYCKCGLLVKAQEVFDKLSGRNVVSWNTLIAGYAQQGQGEEALHCFKQMQLKGISPDAFTFASILKACGIIGAIDKGREVHAEIARQGLLEEDVVVGNALVDMYAKCGSLTKAQEVFDKLPVRNVVSWSALIAGYVQQGRAEEALNCFEQMRLEGVSPNAVTFMCSLKACSCIGAAEKGQKLHAEIVAEGLLKENIHLGTAVVDMYVKCGSLSKAQEVFDSLGAKDVILWNALMAGYAQYGRSKEALDCFEQMQLKGLSPDAATFVHSLKACGTLGAIGKGQEMHDQIARKGFLEKDVCTALIDMYAKCGLLAEAQEVLAKLPVRDTVSWSALISGYTLHGQGEEALNCYELMQSEGVCPDAITFLSSLKACGIIGAIDKGREIHAEIDRQGLLESDMVVGTAVIDMYAKCGLLAVAQEVFDKLPFKSVVLWNVLIAGYAQYGSGDKALECFEKMQLEGFSPTAVTFTSSLQACGTTGTTEKGHRIHADIDRKGLLEEDIIVGNALIDMYAKCGSLAKAQEVFVRLPFHDVLSWNALIAGYAQIGGAEDAFKTFYKMQKEGVKPDLITFIGVLNACSHTGLPQKGQMYFQSMIKDYGITPSFDHLSCMVDLFCRAGQLEIAVALIEKMPFQANHVVWHIVLGACQKWGNVDLARHAFDHTLLLDEKDPAPYVCMSNIFSDAGMEEDAKKVDAVRLQKTSMVKSMVLLLD